MIITATILSATMFCYYLYIGVIYNFVKSGSIYNTPNKDVFELRSKYDIKIKTYRREGRHYGFCWWNTIYLNERLFSMKHPKTKELLALKWTFHHEYYHLKHHVKKVAGLRLLMSLTPMLLIVGFWVFIAGLFCLSAIIEYLVNNKFEKQAEVYAEKMMKDGRIEN